MLKKNPLIGSYPKCPLCKSKGPLVGKGIRQCLYDSCDAYLYWEDGYTEDHDVPEHELHESKEQIMKDQLIQYIEKKLSSSSQ